MNKTTRNKWDEVCESLYPIAPDGVNFLTLDNRFFKLKDMIEKETINKILRIHSINLNNMKVLDLGCGTGRLSFFFEKFGAKVIGVDISEEFLKVAKKNKEHLSSNVDFIHSDLIGFLQSTDFLDAELIVLSGVLCCFNEQQVAYILDLLRAKLSKSSYILIKEHISSRREVKTNISGVRIFFRTKNFWNNVLKIFDKKIKFYSCDLYMYSILKKTKIYERVVKLIYISKDLIFPLDFIFNKVRSYFLFLK